MKILVIVALLIVSIAPSSLALTPGWGQLPAQDPKAAPAYEVLILRRVALESELLDLLMSYTAAAPIVRSKQFEFSTLNREIERVQSTDSSVVPKLSSIYGNLILRRVRLEVELNDLSRAFTPQHPDVRRKKAEVAALDRELEELLK